MQLAYYCDVANLCCDLDRCFPSGFLGNNGGRIVLFRANLIHGSHVEALQMLCQEWNCLTLLHASMTPICTLDTLLEISERSTMRQLGRSIACSGGLPCHGARAQLGVAVQAPRHGR